MQCEDSSFAKFQRSIVQGELKSHTSYGDAAISNATTSARIDTVTWRTWVIASCKQQLSIHNCGQTAG